MSRLDRPPAPVIAGSIATTRPKKPKPAAFDDATTASYAKLAASRPGPLQKQVRDRIPDEWRDLFSLIRNDPETAEAAFLAQVRVRSSRRADELQLILERAKPAKADEEAQQLPKITITTKRHLVVDDAVQSLSAEESVFQRGHMLVTILRDPLKSKVIQRPVGSPRITLLPNPTLGELLTKNANWCKWIKTKQGADEVPAHPPDWAILGVASRGVWPDIRPIEAVIETPCIRPDGTVLDLPGWDPETCLFYEPNIVFPKVPDRLTRDTAREAARLLLDVVRDFPFKDDTHRASWLAALLTAIVRFAILGPVPLFLFDANCPGAGKSKLADIIAILTTGRPMPRTSYPETDDEMRKRLTAIALAGDRLMLIDNVASTFGGPSLDAALTSTTWQDRILAQSKMTPELPMFTVFYATGNNFAFRGDVVRRINPTRLESKDERPEERTDFKIKGDLLRYVQEHRAPLVTAALTLVRAYFTADCPKASLPSIDYVPWCDVVRQPIYWATDLDPCAPRADLRATDPDSIYRAALVKGWAELPGGDTGLTTAEALDKLKGQPQSYDGRRAVFMNWSRTSDLPSARSIGMRLNALRGRVIEGLVLESKVSNNTQCWFVRACGPTGTNGTTGTNPHRPPTHESALQLSD